jgi:hypothetical protein
MVEIQINKKAFETTKNGQFSGFAGALFTRQYLEQKISLFFFLISIFSLQIEGKCKRERRKGKISFKYKIYVILFLIFLLDFYVRINIFILAFVCFFNLVFACFALEFFFSIFRYQFSQDD